MSPRSLAGTTFRETPLLRSDQSVGEAVRALLQTELPALPVVEADGILLGIFGEREFVAALFPGYLGELRSAAFVSESIEDVIDKRIECRLEPVARYTNREHVAAGPHHSDTELAETFLHHRVLVIPIVEDQRVLGVVTRSDFFNALVERFIDRE
ncbi:MAG: CBS domain-containing protein [Thermoleophilaceae bacterium]